MRFSKLAVLGFMAFFTFAVLAQEEGIPPNETPGADAMPPSATENQEFSKEVKDAEGAKEKPASVPEPEAPKSAKKSSKAKKSSSASKKSSKSKKSKKSKKSSKKSSKSSKSSSGKSKKNKKKKKKSSAPQAE